MSFAEDPLNLSYEQQLTGTPGPSMNRSLKISPRKVAFVLVLISLFLLAGNLLSIYLTYTGKNNLSVLYWYTAWYLDFNVESNFPSFFSTMLLMFATVLCGLIYWYSSMARQRDRLYWGVLSLLFLFLSLDENIQFHEKIAEHLTPMLPTDLNGFIYWSWVVPYAVLILLGGLFFLSFLLRLPAPTKRLFVLSGIVFISGALGLELFEGYFFKLYGLDHIINKILYCVEELMEMWGVILFIYALLAFIKKANIRLDFGKGSS